MQPHIYLLSPFLSNQSSAMIKATYTAQANAKANIIALAYNISIQSYDNGR